MILPTIRRVAGTTSIAVGHATIPPSAHPRNQIPKNPLTKPPRATVSASDITMLMMKTMIVTNSTVEYFVSNLTMSPTIGNPHHPTTEPFPRGQGQEWGSLWVVQASSLHGNQT